jgi:hypothetical protein
MAKPSLNQAAKYAGVAKKTLLERLKSNDLTAKLSGEKNAQGHWEIDEAELDRVFRKPRQEPHGKTVSPPLEKTTKTSPNSALEIEVKMLREQIERMDTERERDRLTKCLTFPAITKPVCNQSCNLETGKGPAMQGFSLISTGYNGGS